MNVIFYIEKCLIPKLAKNVDETERHSEYKEREAELQKHFELVVNGLRCANLGDNLEISAKILSAVLILYKDLLTKGHWATDRLVEYANKLSAQCESLYEVMAADLIKKEHILGDAGSQLIFDECMKSLHLKLTSNEFKKYPSLIEVYCSFIQEVQDYNNIKVNVTIMPISLYLVDDYNFDYKKKGLNCMENILKHLEPSEFEGGNYYEVIYGSLKRALTERDIEITRLVIDCLKEFLSVLPTDSDFKTSTSDKLFANVLEYISLESSLYRKVALFRFMKHLIQTSGVNCVNRKMFRTVVCYNLDVCCIRGMDDIMLLPILDCLEEWVKHCWCAWRLSTEENILTMLIKVLCIIRKDEIAERIVKITAALITLSTSEEKQKIHKSLEAIRRHRSKQFHNRLTLIINTIN